MIRRLCVIGTGLIGASAALAARRAGVEVVSGWDPDADSLAIAADNGAVAPAASLEEALADAELAIVAAPVAELPALVRVVLESAPEDCAVTDVGSTKGSIVAAAAGDGRFVGGHPICGAETRGPGRATAELFDGATWFLTPAAATPPARFRMLHAFVDRARRATDRDRSRRPRPARRGHEPSPSRARECPPQPGRLRRGSTATTRSMPPAARCAT